VEAFGRTAAFFMWGKNYRVPTSWFLKITPKMPTRDTQHFKMCTITQYVMSNLTVHAIPLYSTRDPGKEKNRETSRAGQCCGLHFWCIVETAYRCEFISNECSLLQYYKIMTWVPCFLFCFRWRTLQISVPDHLPSRRRWWRLIDFRVGQCCIFDFDGNTYTFQSI